MTDIKYCIPNKNPYCKQCFEDFCKGVCNLDELVRGKQN